MLFTLLMLFVTNPARAEALPAATDGRSQTVRVLLTRLKITDRIDLALQSPYGVKLENGTELHFAGGSELAVLLRGGALYVYYEGMSLLAGKAVTLTHEAVEDGTEFGLRRANFPALYAGDLELAIADDVIRPVLSIDVEDYLLGVVPYEMSNSFPYEALKAQAVASRTYALHEQDKGEPYDVVDTSNDQVYRGYEAGNESVEKAVAETRGICGFYKGKLAQCYYSASNGGQTERTLTVWPKGSDLAYYAFGTDKYDVENPASTVKSIELAKQYAKDEIAPYGLRKLLAVALSDKLQKLGYDPAPESIQVGKVLSVTVDTPSGAADSKLMTMLHMKVELSGRTRTGGSPVAATPAPSKAAQVSAGGDGDEEVSLFAPKATATPAPSAAATLESTPEPPPAPSYGPFEALDEPVVLDVPIFPTAEDCFAMNISSNFDNEIWTVRETQKAFVVEARRFGHGVGLSQRGAQWMAGSYQWSYTHILAFYYPGMELLQYPPHAAVSMKLDDPLTQTAGPAPSPTPRPTLMPATMQAQEGQWFAEVTGIDDDSTLNLRSSPDMGGDVAMRLYKHQRLLVVERCPEDGWVKVRTDATEGYVVERFLTKLD